MDALKQALMLKVAGIIGAVILLILQSILTGETLSIEKNTASIAVIEDKISKEIGDVLQLIKTNNGKN